MLPEATNAAIRVNSPNMIKRPVTSSMTPAYHAGQLPVGMPNAIGQSNSVDEPNAANRNPNTARNRLKTAGAYELRRESTLVVMLLTLRSWDPAVNRCAITTSRAAEQIRVVSAAVAAAQDRPVGALGVSALGLGVGLGTSSADPWQPCLALAGLCPHDGGDLGVLRDVDVLMQCDVTPPERMTRNHSRRDCFTTNERPVHGGSVPTPTDNSPPVTLWREIG